jgi:hypothetical protein
VVTKIRITRERGEEENEGGGLREKGKRAIGNLKEMATGMVNSPYVRTTFFWGGEGVNYSFC